MELPMDLRWRSPLCFFIVKIEASDPRRYRFVFVAPFVAPWGEFPVESSGRILMLFTPSRTFINTLLVYAMPLPSFSFPGRV